MLYRALGPSDIKVSEVSLGCWTMGGLNWVNGTPNGWANVNEDDITAAIKRAVDAGVNHFDNADVYGNGQAELMLACVLKRHGLKANDFVIATKVGHFSGSAPRTPMSRCTSATSASSRYRISGVTTSTSTSCTMAISGPRANGSKAHWRARERSGSKARAPTAMSIFCLPCRW
jgi:aryl-alcohol dehydrogenase-like predicted oxidoreductase